LFPSTADISSRPRPPAAARSENVRKRQNEKMAEVKTGERENAGAAYSEKVRKRQSAERRTSCSV
jgi:hypothetical protein